MHEKISGGKFKMSFGKFEDLNDIQLKDKKGYNTLDQYIACKNIFTILRFRSPHIINVFGKN